MKKPKLSWRQRILHEQYLREQQADAEYEGKGSGGFTINIAAFIRKLRKLRRKTYSGPANPPEQETEVDDTAE